jgi:hypothetical protein
VDRAADFRTLAQWFSQCADDRAAHELWRAAFGLAPARHFDLHDADQELVPPGTSWWEAPPVEVPLRLRSHGNAGGAGRPSAAPDHSLTRQWIAQKRRRERAQLQEAVRRFAGHGALRVSSFVSLDGAEFDLFLALFEEALAAARQSDGSRKARTSDGRLRVTLRLPKHLDGNTVKLITPSGELHSLDYAIEVEDLLCKTSDIAPAPILPSVVPPPRFVTSAATSLTPSVATAESKDAPDPFPVTPSVAGGEVEAAFTPRSSTLGLRPDARDERSGNWPHAEERDRPALDQERARHALDQERTG